MKALDLLRLLQLAAPSLPIGGYSHSHGLESAVLHGVVVDEASALRFITDAFEFSLRTFELPLLHALHAAWLNECPARVRELNEEVLATRESAELRAASAQMGYSLRALLAVLPDIPSGTLAVLQSLPEPALPCAWSAAAAAWGIDARAAALAYAWSWAENQVLAALKAVPLGQSAGQRMLLALGTKIAAALEQPLPELAAASNFAPALAILSARHETQYSRLFRS